MNKLFIASNNAHKISEIKDILLKNNITLEILCPKNFDDNTEPDENGTSFKENAYIKAKYYFDKYHYATLADDSGICIDFFDGAPGIHSARFLSEYDYVTKNEIILERMKNATNRRAVFYDVICYIKEDGEVNYYEGSNVGEISLEQKGTDGFGYDPIFLIPEFKKTEAELGLSYKNEHSHRAKALKKWVIDAK